MKNTYSQTEHERINAKEYPGTRQLCKKCDEPTGKCEDDTLSVGDLSPLCEDCYDAVKNIAFKFWCVELSRIAQEKYNYKCCPVEDCGAESWRDYFDMEYSPEEALVEDISNAT
jgi:hypothetical protein